MTCVTVLGLVCEFLGCYLWSTRFVGTYINYFEFCVVDVFLLVPIVTYFDPSRDIVVLG